MIGKVEGQKMSPSTAGPQSESVVVRKGDTVSTIAAQYKVSEKDLLNANPQIKNPKQLSPGQELMLPQQTPQPGRTSSGGGFSDGPSGRGTNVAQGAVARPDKFSMGSYGAEISGASIGQHFQDLKQLSDSAGFAKLNSTHQKQMLAALDQRASDKNFRRELNALTNSSAFLGLSDSEKTQMINNISTHGNAATYVQSLKNDQLLALAESPSGTHQLDALRAAIQSSGINTAERAELDRIRSATFSPGIGLTVNGTTADQATYLHMVRREMLNSPSFGTLMNTQNADSAHPITIEIGRSQPLTMVDAFHGNGKQTIDLDDLEQWPENVPAKTPDAMTRGENLVHAMAEVRQGALGNNFLASHRRAIQAENQYRADIGQTSRMKLPPNDMTKSAEGNTIFQFDNGYKEEIFKDATGESITDILSVIPLGVR